MKSLKGRNYLINIPHEIAQRLDLDEVKDYTFHSFRRSAATTCADQEATDLQMQSHFGWKNPTLAQDQVLLRNSEYMYICIHVVLGIYQQIQICCQ